MLFDLIVIILACLCIPGFLFGGGLIVLMFPAWLRQLETPDPSRDVSPQMGCLYLLVGPFRLLSLYAWRFILQPVAYFILILVGGLIVLVMRFGILMRAVESTANAWADIADRLWQDNLNAEGIFRASSRQNTQRTRGFLERVLLRFAPVRLLNRSLLYTTYDFLGVSPAIPTVLAAIAQDEARPISERLNAVNVLSRHGYRPLLLNIAMDLRRDGEIVCQAVEALEMRLDWRAAEQAWVHLLEHIDPGVRLRAANHLKFDPAQVGKAVASLRLMYNDERLPFKTRLESAAALGRVNRLAEHDLETIREWMVSSPDQEARLHAAYTLACLQRDPAAFAKLRRYCYEYQHPDHLRRLAIDYLGRQDRFNDLRPLGHMEWIEPAIRLRVGEILFENGRAADAVRCWMAVAQDAKAPLRSRLEGLQSARRIYAESATIPPRDVLVDALSSLGSDVEPAPWMRFEAARTLLAVGEVDPARHILLILSQAATSEPALRRQAASELRRLSYRPV
jgi:hypothetical protein